MKKAIVGTSLVLSLLIACAASDENPPPDSSNGRPARLSSAEGDLSSEQLSEVSKETAVKLAQTHLALKNWSWGEAESVVERDGKFYVYYKTPERELRLVGARVLIVDKETQVVTAQKRR